MLKKLLNSGQAQVLNKNQQKSITGGKPPTPVPECYSSSDPECCGTEQWQCGIGPYSGGNYRNGLCYCF